jgi:hypothetical protein
MDFDIIEFAQNYDLFHSITGRPNGAIGLYVFSVIFIFIISFVINGLTLGRWLPSVKGKGAVMSFALVVLIAVIGEVFYSFLEFFKIPLAWLYKYWWVVLIGIFVFSIICGIMAIVIEERKEKKNTKNKNNTINGN